MADATATIAILLEDNERLVAQLKKATDALKALNSEAGKIGKKKIEIDVSSLDRAQKELKETADASRKLAEEGKRLEREFTQALRNLDKASKRLGFDPLSRSAQNLRARVDEAGRSLIKFGQDAPRALKLSAEEARRVEAAVAKANKQWFEFQRAGNVAASAARKVAAAEKAAAAAARKLATDQRKAAVAAERLAKAEELAAEKARRLAAAQRAARKAALGFQGTMRSLRSTLAAVGVLLLARRLTRLVGTAVEVKRVFDGIEQTLKAVTDTTADYNRAQALVLDTARRLGLEIAGLGQDYANFLASTKPLALSQRQIEDAFVAVSEAGRVLNLSQQRLNLTFLALSQIASKGIATMEELRRQLGDQLPGVFPRVAAAMGVTTTALIDMIRKGEVLAEDVIPAITKAAKDLAGGQVLEATKTLAASVARLGLEYELWLKALAEGAEEGLKSASERTQQLLRDNQDLAGSLGELAGDLPGVAVGLGDLFIKPLRDAIQFREEAGRLPGLFELIGSKLVFGAEEISIAFNETFDSVQGGAKLSGKSLEQLAEEAGRTGEAAARAAGKVEESGRRVAQGIAESLRLLAAAREDALQALDDVGDSGLQDFLDNLEQQVRAVKESFREQKDARRAALDDQLAVERGQTTSLIGEFEKRSTEFSVAENKRVEAVEQVSQKLLDLERETARKRAEVIAKAAAEAEKASTEQREQILKDAQEDLLKIEVDLAEKREDIVRDGIEKLEKLERQRAETAKKELKKIEEAEEKLAEKRKEFAEEALEGEKELREFLKGAFDEAQGDGEAGGGAAQRQKRLNDLLKERNRLQTEGAVLDPGEIDSFNTKLSELNKKILNLRRGFDEFGNSVSDNLRRSQTDLKDFSDNQLAKLLGLLESDSFRAAFNSLGEGSQEFARRAIADFGAAAAAGNLTEQSVRTLVDILDKLGVVGPDSAKGVKDAIDRLGEPTDAEAEIGKIEAKIRELGGAGDAAAPGLEKIDSAVGGIAEKAPAASTALSGIGSALSEGQESISAAGDSLGAIRDSLAPLADSANLLENSLPVILGRLQQAVDDETLGKIGADIQTIVDAVDESAEGLTALKDGLEAIVAAGEESEKVTALATAIGELASAGNIEKAESLAASLKEIALEIEKAGEAAIEVGGDGGPIAKLIAKFGELLKFITDKIKPGIEGLNEDIASISTALEEQGEALEVWEGKWTGSVNFIRQLLAELLGDVGALDAALRKAEDQANKLGDTIDDRLGSGGGAGVPIAGARGPVQPRTGVPGGGG